MKAFTDKKADEISGLETPDDLTLVINLSKPSGDIANGSALGMPCTVPVPKDYAQEFDKGKQSTYGDHQVFTGPYMIENDGKGKVTGYEPGKRLSLVRNPSWDKSTDFKPAILRQDHLDVLHRRPGRGPENALRAELPERGLCGPSGLGAEAGAVVTEGPGLGRVERREPLHLAQHDGEAARRRERAPGHRAVIDRTALRQTRGGPTLGTIATHFLPPGVAGFEEAGGEKGPGFDFMSSPTSNVALAKQYMEKAGYENGVYDGPPILTIADNESPAKETAEAFQEQVRPIGLKLQFREVPHATMLSKFCQVPASNTAICPNLGWGADFFAAQSFFVPLFYGPNLVPSGNVNTAEVDDPKLDAQIDKARQITDAGEAAQAWADLDKEVTSQVYFIPWLWDNNIGLQSTNMNGVSSAFNSGAYDFAFSSVK